MKAAYLFAEHAPPDVDHFIMSVSPENEMAFLWDRFIRKYDVELVYDDWNPGDWSQRFQAWDRWRADRSIEGHKFDYYRELHLRIHGHFRQPALCGSERGLGRRNIYQYWWCGQEGSPDELPPEVDWFDDSLIDHPPHEPTRDVYISPHAKTQGNAVFTFDFWAEVVHRLVEAGVSVTVGYNGYFCDDLDGHPLYCKHWGDHKQWMDQVCSHRLVACGNTGTGWLAAACGVPMITMEPPGSMMPDHRYRQCGLRNIAEVVDVPDAAYVARRIIEEVRPVLVMTTGCYDILHAGHVRHLERSRALGTRLVVAMNSDASVRGLKGPGRPINPEGQRRAVLEALRCVDEVRLFDEAAPLGLIAELRPDVLTAGFGYEPGAIIGRHFVEGWGGKVVVTYQGDASTEPSTTKIIRRIDQYEIGDLCRLACAASVNPVEKLRLMADHFASVRDLPGDVADLGACRGGTSLILRRLAPDKHLHVFDTWEGTPYDDPLCHHKSGEWAARLEDCQELVGSSELTYYHRGVFPDVVLLDDECRECCFVYVDMDTEQATRDAIAFFWPRLVLGGKMVIDDFGWHACMGVEKAVREAFSADQIRELPSLYTCVVEKR